MKCTYNPCDGKISCCRKLHLLNPAQDTLHIVASKPTNDNADRNSGSPGR